MIESNPKQVDIKSQVMIPINNFKIQGELKILEKFIKYLDKRDFIKYEPISKPDPIEIIELDSPEKEEVKKEEPIVQIEETK